MVNGTNYVWNFLDRNTDIKRDLARDVINLHSLAHFILRQNPQMELQHSGVVSAVKRYIEEHKFDEKNTQLDTIFAHTKLEMNFGNVVLHIKKTEHSLSALTELFKKLNLIGEDNVNLIMDKMSFALIFDNDNYQLIRGQFTSDKIINELDNIGQVVLKFHPSVLKTPNVFATILNEVGINDINVIDSITKREKFMIFVEEKDLMSTCNILYKFTKIAKEGQITV